MIQNLSLKILNLMNKLAVLITCYNRINTTLKCLDHFFKSKTPSATIIDIFLLDDNSPDGTGDIISEKYPHINIINGDGNLFWNGGMRKAWSVAYNTYDYDFYLWLNDDTYVYDNFLTTIFKDYFYFKNKGLEALISGSLRDPLTKEITYVGRQNTQILVPNNTPQECNMIPGNIVFVSKAIFHEVGNLNSLFTHGFGDTDYGLRVVRKGFICAITSIYIGECKANDKILWHNSKLSFKQRKELLFSITGGNIFEYMRYVKIHRGSFLMILSIFKTVIRLFVPKLF